MIVKSLFKPAWWLKHCHLQTIMPRVIRKHFHLSTQPELLELPDGDFVELAWTQKVSHQTTTPIVLVFHGLEGSVNSVYAKGMMKAIADAGWTGVLMHFRGCGSDINRLARAYHSGETDDANYFINHIRKHYPNSPLAAVGFSLGGNVLAKYLGEQGDKSPLSCAAVICAPFDLASSSHRITQGSSKIYQKYLLDMLKTSTINKLQKMQQGFPLSYSPYDVKRFKTLREFDNAITAPIHGFIDAEDYYQRASGMPFLKSIRVPSLIIHAKDDPFMSDAVIPKTHQLSSAIRYELSEHGGHVGFIAGHNPRKPIFWLEHRIPQFFAEHF
ncbi:hydrolase [Flocculibacter collagenilyticus]|uniref:hydrolase n=1 Tax=Flocculibacter collagenilyticus TaxID=2744479 RepID=UPI0018F485DC|nr:hydrolase [Flocculibacter collagenilyticus]